MAKVHKAHKSSKKYGFQKKKLSAKALLILLAVVVVAAIGLKIAYDNYLTGEFEVEAPAAEQLNNIAANWELLNGNTEKFENYFTMMGMSADGTDGNGNMLLLYTGNENVDEVALQIKTTPDPAATEVTTSGSFMRTTLTDFINGVAPWGKPAIQMAAATDNCLINIIDRDAEVIDDALLAQIIGEIEAIIAAGPVAAEEPAEAAETTEAAE